MSVVVRGMVMPERCRSCPFESYISDIGQTYCSASLKVLATAFRSNPYDSRPKWCPLFELKDWKEIT